MKVIFVKDVPGVAHKGQVKEVKVGFWRNFLRAGDLAREATPQLIELAEKEKEKEISRVKESEQVLAKAVKGLENEALVMEMNADEKGNLFEGVTSEKISERINEVLKLDIPAKFIKLEKPIKKIGLHVIPVKEISFKLEIKAKAD